LGSNPSSSATSSTRARVVEETGCDEPESTRETVDFETPAVVATSWSETARPVASRALFGPDTGRQ
jgi:hypothetical protein